MASSAFNATKSPVTGILGLQDLLSLKHAQHRQHLKDNLSLSKSHQCCFTMQPLFVQAHQ